MLLNVAADSGARRNIVKEIQRLRLIPDALREYTINPRDAEKQFGLTGTAIRTFVAAGLPHRQSEDTVRFSPADLTYLAIRLETARAHLAAFAFIARSLEQFADRTSTHLTVCCIPRLPRQTPQLPGAVVLPDGERRELDLVHNQVAAEIAVVVRARSRPTPRALIEAVNAAGPLELYSLPRPLVGDVLFARRTGLSECLTAAHLLVECCRNAGYEARVSEGLMVAVPWSNPHYWCEVRIDDEWFPLDPLMIRALRAFGALEAESWPTHRFLTPILARFAPGAFPIVTRRQDGARVDTTFLTSVASSRHS